MSNLEFGVVGLGHMGGNLVLYALEKGSRVVGFDRGPVREDLLQAGLVRVDSIGGSVRS
jgi:6-phosphogluconate dehydrogenase (decarboxylating)